MIGRQITVVNCLYQLIYLKYQGLNIFKSPFLWFIGKDVRHQFEYGVALVREELT
mgnify:FL=1